jgi:hypothetical protein
MGVQFKVGADVPAGPVGRLARLVVAGAFDRRKLLAASIMPAAGASGAAKVIE